MCMFFRRSVIVSLRAGSSLHSFPRQTFLKFSVYSIQGFVPWASYFSASLIVRMEAIQQQAHISSLIQPFTCARDNPEAGDRTEVMCIASRR